MPTDIVTVDRPPGWFRISWPGTDAEHWQAIVRSMIDQGVDARDIERWTRALQADGA